MAFLTHFQLSIRYETGTELLTSLWQSTATHISDHIHEWRRCQRLIKASIPNQILEDWFTKSLFPPIDHDIAMGGAITKEQAISRAQYLDLVYSQSSTLYDLIPHDPFPTYDPSKPSEAHTDGIIGSLKSPSKKQSSIQPSNLATTSKAPTKSTPTPSKTFDISAVPTTPNKNSQQSRGKNKKKRKKNKPSRIGYATNTRYTYWRQQKKEENMTPLQQT